MRFTGFKGTSVKIEKLKRASLNNELLGASPLAELLFDSSS